MHYTVSIVSGTRGGALLYLIPCREYKDGFRVVRWGKEEGVKQHKFPVRAWIAIKGLLFNHWNRNDLSKIFSKHAQILDISDSTLEKTDLSAARMYVGCDELGSIPKRMTVIIGSSCYNITIKIEAQIKEPVEVRVSQEEMERGERLLEGSLGV